MDEFCKTRGLQRKLVCFIFNGNIVLETDTPMSVGLKKDDDIDVYDW